MTARQVNSRAPAGRCGSAGAAEGSAVAQKNNCTACHTATLAGQQHIPRLAGQHRDYLAIQLQGFRAGTRAEMDGVMTSAAQGLSPADIELLADYLSTLATP